MNAPNKALLKRTLQHIKTHPKQWEQSNWITRPEYRDDPSCGTAYCFAGWAVALSGYQITSDGDVPIQQLPLEAVFRLDMDGLVFISEGRDAQKVAEIRDVATLLLGIPVIAANNTGCHLFCGHNDLNDLERFVAELCGDTAETAAES